MSGFFIFSFWKISFIWKFLEVWALFRISFYNQNDKEPSNFITNDKDSIIFQNSNEKKELENMKKMQKSNEILTEQKNNFEKALKVIKNKEISFFIE